MANPRVKVATKTPRQRVLDRIRSVQKREVQKRTLGGFWIMVRGRPVFVRSDSPTAAVKSTTKAGTVRKAQAEKIKPSTKPTRVLKSKSD